MKLGESGIQNQEGASWTREGTISSFVSNKCMSFTNKKGENIVCSVFMYFDA